MEISSNDEYEEFNETYISEILKVMVNPEIAFKDDDINNTLSYIIYVIYFHYLDENLDAVKKLGELLNNIESNDNTGNIREKIQKIWGHYEDFITKRFKDLITSFKDQNNS